VFQIGFRDYISYPYISAEIRIRLGYINTSQPTQDKQLTSKKIDPAVKQSFLQAINLSEPEVKLVTATCAFLLEDISIHRDINSLAHQMGTNRNFLAHAFKHTLGKGVYEWLREQRMMTAIELLTVTNISIQEISFNVGYEDPANFSTSFKQMIGLPPSFYRQIMRKSKL